MNDDEILANFAQHKATPQISPQDYFKSLRDTLGTDVIKKRRIYLDTRYWVLLRDAMLGSPQRDEHTTILDLIRDSVHNGDVVCPLSDTAYVEAMQQTDSRTRLATAALMDELSCGTAICTEKTRVQMEFVDFFKSPGLERLDIEDKVWVSAGFVLGENVPYSQSLDPKTNASLQKSFIDFIWHHSVSQFAVEGHDSSLALAMSASAENINGKMIKHAQEIRSFQQAFTAEVSGCVTLFDDQVAKMVLQDHGRVYSDSEVEKFKIAMQTMLFNVFRLRPQIMALRAPTLYIHAKCHAAIRWDKFRRLDGHWLMDIHHASAAVAYHHAMFTETPLKVLLKSGNLALDKTYKINILSCEAEVIEYLTRPSAC
jgi:hypothetical protein